MAFYLTRRYRLSALHSLSRKELSDRENLELYGPCFRLHGHDYQIEVTVTGALDDQTGLVKKRDDLDQIVKKRILDPLEGTNLNSKFACTTGEFLVREFFRSLESHLEHLHRLVLHETPKNTFIVHSPHSESYSQRIRSVVEKTQKSSGVIQ